ncbi:hypothetical protein EON67_07120 [archaeon]|nr:MAG: hypothetical protein EON67_07120 [archaeon]
MITIRCRYFVSRARGGTYLPSGSYAGGWASNVRHGFGCQLFPNGDKYVAVAPAHVCVCVCVCVCVS